jgi:phage/plasmid-associated DNA primase
MSERIAKDTKEYINNNDPVQQFIDDRVIKSNNPNDVIQSSYLYESFLDYRNNETDIKNAQFKNILLSKGITSKRTKKGVIYLNIRLNA